VTEGGGDKLVEGERVHSGDFSKNLIFGLEFLDWLFPAIF
jgi:hypothetical protein